MRTARAASQIRGLPARPRCSLALTEGQDYDPLDHFPGAAGPPVNGRQHFRFTLRLQLLRRQTQAFFAQLSPECLPQGETRGDPERKCETFPFANVQLEF